jgi:hypothetical protein
MVVLDKQWSEKKNLLKKEFFVVQIQFQKVKQNPYYNYRPITDFIRMILELHYIRIHIPEVLQGQPYFMGIVTS